MTPRKDKKPRPPMRRYSSAMHPPRRDILRGRVHAILIPLTASVTAVAQPGDQPAPEAKAADKFAEAAKSGESCSLRTTGNLFGNPRGPGDGDDAFVAGLRVQPSFCLFVSA